MKQLPLFIMLVLLIAACKPQDYFQNRNSAFIELSSYGGFTPEDHAKEQLRVQIGKVTLRIFAYNGTLMNEIVKPISDEQFGSLLDSFEKAKFFSLKPVYMTPDGQAVMDAGVGEFTLTIDGKTKTVKVDPYMESAMPAPLREINSQLRELTTYAMTTSERDAQDIAQAWITEAPTYRFDGSQLTFVSSQVLESFPPQAQARFSFTSSHTGYGDRTGQTPGQVTTQHDIIVTVSQGRVISAVIDEVWDEMAQKKSRPDTITLRYDLMQCLKTPWADWLEKSDIRFIRAPTEKEVASMYFSNQYGITLIGFETRTENILTCEACGVCASGTYYLATISENDANSMVRLGWHEDTQPR